MLLRDDVACGSPVEYCFIIHGLSSLFLDSISRTLRPADRAGIVALLPALCRLRGHPRPVLPLPVASRRSASADAVCKWGA